jgi:hypothetical protein
MSIHWQVYDVQHHHQQQQQQQQRNHCCANPIVLAVFNSSFNCSLTMCCLVQLQLAQQLRSA